MCQFLESAFSSKIFWLTAIVLTLYLYMKKICYSYWTKHGVPHDKPVVPFGNLSWELFMKKITFGDIWRKNYESSKHHRFHGAYTLLQPILMLNDPELIKQILIKNFTKFSERGLYYNKKVDPMSNNLFFMNTESWRIVRTKLSPSFTGNKLRYMFPFITEVGYELIKACNVSLLKSDIFEVKNMLASYTIDIIFSIAFGCNSNTINGEGEKFHYYGNLAIKNSPLRNMIIFFFPNLSKKLRVSVFDKKASNFFKELFVEMVEKRRMDKVKRQDLLSFLVELIDNEQIIEPQAVKEKALADKVTKKMELIDAAAQAMIFFLAGFETSSSIATHTLYELALNPEVQTELQKEIDEVLENDGALTFENLFQMTYLDMVVSEALRMHPSLPFLNRVSLEKYQIPNSNFTIPKGMPIIISITGLHYDPNLFPEPNKFDPTRFTKENIETRRPCTYLPFGEGPRNCIGKRLGLMQVKVVIFLLLSNYTFSVCEKTTIPRQYSTETIVQAPKAGVYLRVYNRKNSIK